LSPAIRRNIQLLSLFNLCLDFRIYAPIAVVYFAHVTGSYALAVLIFSIAKIASTMFEVPTGVFSDFAGRKATLIVGQIASVFSIGSYAVADGFTVLAAGAVFEGLAFACFSGNNEALLYETLKQEGAHAHYAEYQGRVSSMFQIALAVSALVAAVILSRSGMRMLFVFSLIPQLAGLIVALFFREPAQHDRRFEANVFAHVGEAFGGFRRDMRLRDLSIASILGFAIGEAKHMFYPAFFALLWPSWALGIAGMLVHAFAAVGFRAAGRLIQRFREFPVLLWSNIASIVFGVGAVAIPTGASPVVSSLASFPFGPSVVAQGSLMQKAFTDAQRATMGSLIALGGNLLFALAVFAIGLLADRIGPRYALLTAEILSISVTLLYWRLYRSVEVTRTVSGTHEDQASQR
jgi:MFS family permease